ncbi:hypothetical protein ABZ464_47885 [Streptomyces sp. NPDC005820]|uniref:hypothetical protein n=1 Tax=Streptomyces sp. NPDC005820 TaxID=3157069 RepID=UPI0033E88179
MISVAHMSRLGVAAGAAAVLATGLTTSAQAATGNIQWFNSTGEHLIVNPPDGVCIAFGGHAQLVANNTDKTVNVYFTATCTTLVRPLAPGQAVANGGPQSVLVVP